MDGRVQCAGGGSWNTWDAGLDNGPNPGPKSTPCGWTPFDLATTETQRQTLVDEAKAAVGKCPRCGGKLEVAGGR